MPILKGNFQNYVCLVKIQFRKLFYGITYPNSDRERFTEEKKGVDDVKKLETTG